MRVKTTGQRKQAPPPVVTKEQYDAMTPAERRVALARDVLALLDARKLKAASVYFDGVGDEEAPLEKFLSDPRCYVCARGALAVSWARIADDFEARGMTDATELFGAASHGDHGFFKEVFRDNALFSEIENAYEGYGAYDGGCFLGEPRKVRWNRQYRTPTARLRAICHNLIDNNGAFVPVPGGAS